MHRPLTMALAVFAFGTACGTELPTPPAIDAASDAATDAPRATVTVVFNWVYFSSSLSCQEGPTCTNPACDSTVGCTCRVCANPPCQPNVLTLRCCSQTKMFFEDDLSLLVADYARCALVQTSPRTYSLECGWNDGAPAYSNVSPTVPTIGTVFAHTTDATCAWAPPYAIP